MARDRRRRRRRAGDRVALPASSFEHRPLASALLASAREALVEPAPEVEAPPPPPSLTEAQFMRLAFAELDAPSSVSELARARIIATPARSRTDPSPRRTAHAPAEGPLPEDPDRAAFARELERLGARAPAGPRWRDHHPPPTRTADELERWALTPDQQALLDAVARHVSRGRPLPELTVRKLRRERALERVAEFVHTHRALGHRYVRVITGKGLSSYAAPVLKPELITWCEHRGRGAVVLWAPERDDDGSFGAVVLRLRSSRRAGG